MKKIMPAVLLSLSCGFAAAQISSPTLDSAIRKVPLTPTLIDQGSYSHSTSKGKVYILPYDNMPCLVPHMNQVAQMPNSLQKQPESRMPNAIPRRQLIPKQQKPGSSH
jgi:hypothetical protein